MAEARIERVEDKHRVRGIGCCRWLSEDGCDMVDNEDFEKLRDVVSRFQG